MSTTTEASLRAGAKAAGSIEPSREFEGFSDCRLVELARNGSQEAFGELVRQYESRLMRVISRFISDQALVEDIAQDAFLKAYRRLELFDPSRRFGPWLFQIGVNMTLDYMRRSRRRIKWSVFSQWQKDDDSRPVDPGQADPRAAIDTAQEVRSVLAQVSEKYRTVLILRDLENFSTSEIAAILNRKEATIRWRLAEARAMFQTLWLARQARENSGESCFDPRPEGRADELQDNPAID